MDTQHLPIASNAKRVASFVVDDVTVNMLLMVIFSSQLEALFSHIDVWDEAAVMQVNAFLIANLPIILAIKVLYHTILIWQSGMTLGKYVVQIKAVDEKTGQKLTFLQAFWRASMRLVSEMVFYIGFLFAFFSPKHQTLHDKVSNCVVVDV